jgi:menaquinone-dependent protoporphyrinogen IX oxidase
MKTLVVYYSNAGNTDAAAQIIAKELSADLLRLIPEKEIPKEGIRRFFLGGMKSTFGWGTKLKKYDLRMNEYDQIILGTPVWATSPCPAVNRFLKKIQHTSRITSVFTCSASGDNDKCMKILKKKIPGLKQHVSLYDRKFPEHAGENDSGLKGFIEKCRIA